jgi:acetoin utilization deacetylase AcuC-like enzyme
MSRLVAIEQRPCHEASVEWVIEDGRAVPGRESDRRVHALRKGLMRHAGVSCEPADADPDVIEQTLLTLHDRSYLEALASIDSEEPVVVPELAAPGLTPDVPVCASLVKAAHEGVRTAISAAERVAAGMRFSYALSRPPGHHAGPHWFGGYCYLNTAAAAAVTLLQHGAEQVGILDLDLHYPNGTAAIVAANERISLHSLHSPVTNVAGPKPLRRTAGSCAVEFEQPPTAREYLDSIAASIELLTGFTSAIVLSIGYDTVRNDPHGCWSFSPAIFAQIGRLLAASGLPVCAVQEGGYSLARLAACSDAFATGLLEESTSSWLWATQARSQASPSVR